MAKRYTDPNKWQDGWYLSLNNDCRIVWQYMVDTCSNAGILKKNFKMLNFCCNTELTVDNFLEIFNSRVKDFPEFYFIPKFLKFQNPKGLNSDKPAVISIVNELLSNPFCSDLLLIIKESFGNDYLIVKDIALKDIERKRGVVGEISTAKNTAHFTGCKCPKCR